MELDPEEVKLPLEDSDSQKWLDRLAGRRLAFAYAPRLGPGATDGWIACSWIGGYSQRLRWYAAFGLVDGIEKIGTHSKRTIWRVTDVDLPPGNTLTACVVEGLLFVCMSRDPEGVRHVINTYDGFGTVESFRMMAADRKLNFLWEGVEPDRGWINQGKGFALKLTTHGADGIVGSVNVPYRPEVPEGMAFVVERQVSLGKLLGNVPEAVAVSTGAHVKDLVDFAGMMTPSDRRWINIVNKFIDEAAEQGGEKVPAFAAVFGGDYRGRVKSLYPDELRDMMKGVPVPVIVAGIRVGNSDKGSILGKKLIDWINGSYQFGLITRPVAIGDYTVRAVEGTGDNAYSELEQNEWAGLAACDEWLLLSSNTEILTKLVARYQRSEAMAGIDRGRWLNTFKQQSGDDSMGYVWSDLGAVGVTLKDTLALLRLAATGPRKYRERERLDTAMDWMESVRILEACTVDVVPDGKSVNVNFRVGQAAK
jgi:hypothetical protein